MPLVPVGVRGKQGGILVGREYINTCKHHQI